MKPPAPNPCNDCPWRRNAVRGWLGPQTAEEWIILAHSDEEIACHQTIPSGFDDSNEPTDELTACAGAAIYRANVCKSPRYTEYRLPADRSKVFGWRDEFLEHHARVEVRRNPRDNADDAFQAFMNMDQREFLGLFASLLSGGTLTPAEQEGFERAVATRKARQAVEGTEYQWSSDEELMGDEHRGESLRPRIADLLADEYPPGDES